jgi:hypothetical protein
VHFESTLPFGAPDLMRVSAFRRYLGEGTRPGDLDTGRSRLTSLSPSMLHDLKRFEPPGGGEDGLETLEVIAASVRHGRALLLHLADGDRVVPLTVFPVERLVHGPIPAEELLGPRLPELRVLQVEPAVLAPPRPGDRHGSGDHVAPLAPLLWELALRGAREDLLPEIAGPAAYRVAPGVDLRALALGGTLAAAVHRLRRQASGLREIAEWPGFDRSRAMRMLNGLYLQGGLMVSRTHPAAADGWFGGR